MNINELINKLEKLNGENQYKISEILSNDFIKSNTNFNTFDEFIEKSGVKIDVENIEELYQNKELNEFINSNSNFDSLQSMVQEGSKELIKNKILRY